MDVNVSGEYAMDGLCEVRYLIWFEHSTVRIRRVGFNTFMVLSMRVLRTQYFRTFVDLPLPTGCGCALAMSAMMVQSRSPTVGWHFGASETQFVAEESESIYSTRTSSSQI